MDARTRYSRWLPELEELVAIPSVGVDPAHAADMEAALAWLEPRFSALGAATRIVRSPGEQVLLADLPAQIRPETAPTLLVYGHFDVQPAGDLSLWESPPFRSEIRGEWLYGRGVVDDKGHLVMYLEAVRAVLARGALAINIRFLIDGAEERAGTLALDCMRQMEPRPDGCLIFDGPMIARGRPAFYIATRGTLAYHLHVRTGERDLHSGQFGGAALNAIEALMAILAAARRGPDGRLPAPLRAGAQPLPPPVEETLHLLPEPLAYLAEQGTHPADALVGADMYHRLWAEPSFEVNAIGSGQPALRHMSIPCEAEAAVSLRLAPGQKADTVAAAFEALLASAAPAGASLTLTRRGASDPAVLRRDGVLLEAAADAFATEFGTRPLLIQAGGSLPLLTLLGELGIPTVMTGLDLPEGNIHAPNERLLLEHLEQGTAILEALFSDKSFTR